ncbi:signal peptidase I [Candidatus Parcubacteria bacterium]|nr:MAG: signal peptidase I [Candidatus Parcubacteria bacterium]
MNEQKNNENSLFKEAVIFLWEIIKVVVISLIIILPIRYYVIQPFYVKGASMEPTFYDHEYLIINEISYRFYKPERGDVIVFKYPQNPKEYFIKRVIGLPNETISIKNGEITIYNDENSAGAVLEEDYLLPWQQTVGNLKVNLDQDEYYLLGDNRLSSLDSRIFGPVEREYIIGKVLFRGWPLNRITIFTAEQSYQLKSN